MPTNLTDPFLSIIFPNICAICGSGVELHADGPACTVCWDRTRILDGAESLCEKCGELLSEHRSGVLASCGDCREHLYDRAFSVGVYEKALAASIVYLKREPHLPARLREAVAFCFTQRPDPGYTSLVPVPLSRKRLHERGHNQAAVIARVVGEILGCRVDEHSVERTAHTPMHRGLMDRKARAASVEKVFKVVRPKLISGQKVLLVDDVFTTGSTVSSCAGVLKDAGAESVTVFTIARAVKRF